MTQGVTCTEKETLVAFLYGECDAADRERVERHLAECAACADEVAGFGMVRDTLAEWAPPERIAGLKLVREEAEAPAQPARVLRPARWWQRPLPAWAKAAAAVVFFAAGAAMANLDVTYREGTLTIRTGWQPRTQVAANQPATQPVPIQAAQPSGSEAPWRADLASLERQLREDFRTQLASTTLPRQSTFDERRVFARVEEMIGDSERRTQNDLAMRVAQVQGEFGFQRANDLARMRQGLGQLEGRAGAEALTQRQLINFLLASQKK
jgi:hypothetical protein